MHFVATRYLLDFRIGRMPLHHFNKHQSSKSHRESVDAVVSLPATTGDVGELLNSCHKQEKEVARDMLQIILSSV